MVIDDHHVSSHPITFDHTQDDFGLPVVAFFLTAFWALYLFWHDIP
jgi:hypothetical protein